MRTVTFGGCVPSVRTVTFRARSRYLRPVAALRKQKTLSSADTPQSTLESKLYALSAERKCPNKENCTHGSGEKILNKVTCTHGSGEKNQIKEPVRTVQEEKT